MFFSSFDEFNGQLPWLAIVERSPFPNIGVYEVYEDTYYEWHGDIVKEVHRVRSMSEMEKYVKQQETIANYINAKADPTWVFSAELCDFVPPVPYPTDGHRYVWDRSKAEWLLSDD